MEFILSERLRKLLKKSRNPYLVNISIGEYDYPSEAVWESKKRRSCVDLCEDDPKSISYITYNSYLKGNETHGDPWKATRTKAKVGRFFKWLLPTFEDTTIQEMGLEYTSQVTLFMSERSNYAFEVVSGEDIRTYYREEHHDVESSIYSMDTLGKSCMRYEKLAHLFELYVKNPDHIKMVIYKNCNNDKIVARAILWINAVNGKNFMDRVYGDDNARSVMVKYAQSKGWYTKKEHTWNKQEDFLSPEGKHETYQIELKMNCDHPSAPYLDTFYVTDRKSILRNYQTSDAPLFTMQEQFGGYNHPNMVKLKDGTRIMRDLACMVGEHWYKKSDCAYAMNDYGDKDWRLKRDCHFSNTMGDWIQSRSAYWVESIQDYLYSGHEDMVNTLDGYVYKSEIVVAKCENGVFRDASISQVHYSVYSECYVHSNYSNFMVNNNFRDRIHMEDKEEFIKHMELERELTAASEQSVTAA